MVVFVVLRDERERGSVERARAHVGDARAKESATKFVAGLAGKGHGEDVIARHLTLQHAALNA